MVYGWHSGERAIHERLNYGAVNSQSFMWIEDTMPMQHRLFYHDSLPFLPVTTLDASSRPWGSFLFSNAGVAGFVTSPTESTLIMTIDPPADDPLYDVLAKRERGSSPLVAGVGINLANRRRNKFAGHIAKLQRSGVSLQLELEVNQVIGNCPKYINIRTLIPFDQFQPNTTHKRLNLSPEETLPDEAVKMIQNADTFFIGTTYIASPSDNQFYPSHLGMNHRGGRPGFVRVRADRRSVVLPDYSGNRLMTSLGNIMATPLASLSIADYKTGDILYLTGIAHNHFGPDAQEIQPRSDLITIVQVTGYILIANALPFRQQSGSVTIGSPYSPPVRYLAEESSASKLASKATSIELSKITIHSPHIATFTFSSSNLLTIVPGQAAIVDCTPFVGRNAYQHMAMRGAESSLNDDGIRTWTVSSAHRNPTAKFDITMREKRSGAITPKLFEIANKLRELRPELLDNTTPLGISLQLVGINGDFGFGKDDSRILMLAGGIGVTPYLSMLSSLDDEHTGPQLDIILVISARESDVIADLVYRSIKNKRSNLKLEIHLFSRTSLVSTGSSNITFHQGRINSAFFRTVDDLQKRKIMACGPPEWEQAVLGGLGEAGVAVESVIIEKFAY